jgi:M6 family metalloprotease-like protein
MRPAKLILTSVFSIMFIGVLVSPTSAAGAPHAGAECKKPGQSISSTSFNFLCVKSGKKLRWKATPTTPIVVATPASNPTSTPVVALTRIALNEGCHAPGTATLQKKVNSDWVDVAAARGWDDAPGCAAPTSTRPWTLAAVAEGTSLRWHVYVTGAWDWYSGVYIYQDWKPTGSTVPCKFLDKHTASNVAVGWPKLATSMKSVGTDRIAVLFVDFPDSVATKSIDSLYPQISKSETIFNAMSYGKFDFQVDPLKKWIRMSHPYGYYDLFRNKTDSKFPEYIQEAATIAALDYNFKGVSSVVVISNPDTPYDFGPAHLGLSTKVSGEEIPFAVTSGQDAWIMDGWWLVHESSHTLGLPDLYAFDNAVDSGYDATLGNYGHRYVGDFSVMSNSFVEATAHEMTAWERWQLGWIDDSQISCQSTYPNAVDLSPIEVAGGTKAAIIPLTSTSGIVIESRHALGYDNKLSREGALVYVVDTAKNSGTGPIVVQGGRAGDRSKISALLSNGQSITVDGYRITVSHQSSAGETISIDKS